MRTKITTVLCACLGVAGLHCGSAADSAAPQQTEPPPSESDLLMDIIPHKQPDGTYTRTIIYVTRAQRKAEAEANIEALRLRKQGLLASEIRAGNCNTEQVTELYEQPQFNGNKCCVIGAGGLQTANLCGTGFQFRSMWAPWTGGWYGHPEATCGEWFEADGDYQWLWCDPSNYIQLD
jgi:hypothetical protein